MRGETQQLRLAPDERALIRKMASEWASKQPPTKKNGRPPVLSGYIMELVRRDVRARRPGYVQQRLTPLDQVAQAKTGAMASSSKEQRGEGRVLHDAHWALQLAGSIAPGYGKGRLFKYVDRWVCLDYLFAWLPDRGPGFEPVRVPPPKYMAAVFQLDKKEDRPFRYSVGDPVAIRDNRPYNWGG